MIQASRILIHIYHCIPIYHLDTATLPFFDETQNAVAIFTKCTRRMLKRILEEAAFLEFSFQEGTFSEEELDDTLPDGHFPHDLEIAADHNADLMPCIYLVTGCPDGHINPLWPGFSPLI